MSSGSSGAPARGRATEDVMTDTERDQAEHMIARIEVATGQLPTRDSAHAVIIAEILEAANGLRSLLRVVRPH